MLKEKKNGILMCYWGLWRKNSENESSDQTGEVELESGTPKRKIQNWNKTGKKKTALREKKYYRSPSS